MPAAHLSVLSHQWEVLSFGDFSEFAGIGGGVWHFRFRNGTHHHEDYLLLGIGLGGQVQIPARLLTEIGRRAVSIFSQVVSRAAGAATSDYIRARVRGNLSFNDISCTRAMIACAQAGIGIAGGQMAGLNVMVSRIGPSPAIEADLSGFGYILGAGAFAGGGLLLRIDGQGITTGTPAIAQERRRRSPMDPVVRDPGHY